MPTREVVPEECAVRDGASPRTNQIDMNALPGEVLEILLERAFEKQNERTTKPYQVFESTLDNIMETLDRMNDRLEEHIRREEDMIEKTMQGFPDGDAYGHCQWHKGEIERIHNLKELYLEARKSLVQWGVIGLLGWSLSYFWDHIVKAIQFKTGG